MAGSQSLAGEVLTCTVVALHHSGVPMTSGDTILNINGDPWDPSQGEEAVQWIANEGVRISKIVAHLRGLNLKDAAKEAMLQSAQYQRDDAFNLTAPGTMHIWQIWLTLE